MRKSVAICLLRNDLRVHDNLTLAAAMASTASHVLPLFCMDPRLIDLSRLPPRDDGLSFPVPRTWRYGFVRCSKRRARFIVEAITALRKRLRSIRSDLLIHFGRPEDIIPRLVRRLSDTEHSIEGVYLQQEVTYEETLVERRLEVVLGRSGVPLRRIWGLTMVHLQDLPYGRKNMQDLPDVYTEFRKRVEALGNRYQTVRAVVDDSVWKRMKPFPSDLIESVDAEIDAKLRMVVTNESGGEVFDDERAAFPFKGGEDAALKRLDDYFFQTKAIDSYKQTRNGLVGTDYSSKLSPWLAIGAISPRYIMAELQRVERLRGANDGTYWLWFELLWRDYFKFLAMKYGNQMFKPEGVRPSNGKTEWNFDKEKCKAWTEGKTGIPWVDGNMIELNCTGFMSNRGRQNVASFLVHDINQAWLFGAEYFESQLLDHDPCSNYFNWAYVAGVGTDPREGRQFNMIKQAVDYDESGLFVGTWVPELRCLVERGDPRFHTPWKLKDYERGAAGVGAYPRPLVVRPVWRIKDDTARGNRRA